MSFVTTQPRLLSAVAGNLTGIGSAMNARDSAAAAPIHEMFVNTLGTSAGSYAATEAANAVAAT
jgi:hypothetical protein